MAGQITTIFYVVKLGTGRFVIKYGTKEFMLVSGIHSWVTFGKEKNVIIGILLTPSFPGIHETLHALPHHLLQ